MTPQRSSGALSLLGSTVFNDPTGLRPFDARLDPSGKTLYVVDAGSAVVSAFDVDGGNLTELETLMTSEADGRRIVLDLRDLTLVDQDAVSFLKRCEADNIALKNCPAYIREWITRDRKTREI